MTVPARCPDCSAPIAGEPACSCCGLTLVGPQAGRLWEVDQQIGRLTSERTWLIGQLRRGPAAPPPPPPMPAAPAEVRHRSAQNTLLSLGVLLLAVAGLVLAAVSYDRLGATGRAAALLVLTCVAAAAGHPLLRRGLSASAETTTAIALLLAALDAYGLRSLGLAADTDGLAYAAGTAALLGVTATAYGRVVAVRTAPLAALALLHVAPLLALASTEAPAEATAGAVALVLVALAAADLGLHRARVLTQATLGSALGAGALALLAAGPAAYDGQGLAQLALVALAAVAALAAVLLGDVLAVVPSPLLALAAWSAVREDLTGDQQGLLVAGLALVAAAATAALPVGRRLEALAGALAVGAAAGLSQLEHVVAAVGGPFAWIGDPWTRTSDDARGALSPDLPWEGSLATLGVVGLLAGVVAVACYLDGRRQLPALGVLALGAFLVPLAADLPYTAALAAGLAATTALTVAGLLRERVLLLGALLWGAHVLGWSAADETATLVVAGVLTLLAAVVATRREEAVTLAGALLALEVGAAGAAAGLDAPQVGGLLLAVVALLAGAAHLLSRSAEVPAVLTGVAALALATQDPGWLSWVLAGLGVLVLASALRPDRHDIAFGGALLLAASNWVRLAEAGVEAPEPYVVPLGLVVLALGHLRRGRVVGTHSMAAYAPGLSLLLVPSLLAVEQGGLTRPLLLGLAALVAVLVGAQARLQAPLVIGGVVLALDAVHLLAPYAADLPRWVPLALAGLVLVGVGTTFEQRGRDLARLRERFDEMA